MAKKKKKVKKREKKVEEKKYTVKEVKPVIQYLERDGIIKTDLGYNVVYNGVVEKEHFGSNSFKVATKDYSTLAGV